jgi:diacylglycerol kinase family enzyme
MTPADSGYFYFYDDYTSNKKFEVEINRVETRLLELGLSGRKERLTILKNAKEIIEDGIKRGAKTVVAIGNDATISKVMTIIADYKNVVLGVIPVGPEQHISKLLGIPQGLMACDVLSKRVVKRLDLGKVNDHYFLFSLGIPTDQISIRCDNKYDLSIDTNDAVMHICNIGGLMTESSRAASQCNPADGKLEAIITPSGGSWKIFNRNFSKESVFKIRKATIKSTGHQVTVLADGQVAIKTPAKVVVIPKKLQLIVGRDRQF